VTLWRYGQFPETQLARGQQTGMPGDDDAIGPYQDGVRPTELTNAGCYGGNLGNAVGPGVARVGDHLFDGDAANLQVPHAPVLSACQFVRFGIFYLLHLLVLFEKNSSRHEVRRGVPVKTAKSDVKS
jgi:hypothetical protein